MADPKNWTSQGTPGKRSFRVGRREAIARCIEVTPDEVDDLVELEVIQRSDDDPTAIAAYRSYQRHSSSSH